MQSQFSMTFLGVGGGLTPEFGNNNVLVEGQDPDAVLLLDCGYTTPPKLLEMGRLGEVKHIVITHVHADHVGGLEVVGHLSRFITKQRPNLYVHESLMDELWEGSLRGGMARTQTGEGEATMLGLSDFFELHVLRDAEPVLRIKGLPPITLRPTLHVKGKPAFSVFLGERVYYSSDTQLLPPGEGPNGAPLEAIFQDCQLVGGKSNVHTPLEQLARELPPERKRITHLMHYSHGWDTIDSVAMGFAEFVRPLQRYDFSA
ncbi:ribonuclease Z [compost metagenome]